MRLSVKVVPGSSRDVIAGWLDKTLKIRVSAPPEHGRANAAVEKLIARALGAARGSVRIVRGTRSSRKVVEIDGISESDARTRLAGLQPD